MQNGVQKRKKKKKRKRKRISHFGCGISFFSKKWTITFCNLPYMTRKECFCRIIKNDVCWTKRVKRRNWAEKIAEFSYSLNPRMKSIMARLNERLPKERELLYGLLRIVAELPRWHALAVCDAAPLL